MTNKLLMIRKIRKMLNDTVRSEENFHFHTEQILKIITDLEQEILVNVSNINESDTNFTMLIDGAVSTLHRRATAYKEIDLGKAICCLREATELRPLCSRSWTIAECTRLPLFLQQSGQFEESMKEFQKLLDELLVCELKQDPIVTESRYYQLYDKIRVVCKLQKLFDEEAKYNTLYQQHLENYAKLVEKNYHEIKDTEHKREDMKKVLENQLQAQELGQETITESEYVSYMHRYNEFTKNIDPTISDLFKQATAYKGVNWEKSIRCLQEAAELIPFSSTDWPILQRTRLPLFLQQAGKFEEAMKEFQKLLDNISICEAKQGPLLTEACYFQIYDKMRLACKRQQLPAEEAKYATLYQQHFDNHAVLLAKMLSAVPQYKGF